MSHGAPYRPRRALAPSDEGEGPDDHDWVDQPNSDASGSTDASDADAESSPDDGPDPRFESAPVRRRENEVALAGAGAASPSERLRAMIGERQEQTVEILRSWLDEQGESA